MKANRKFLKGDDEAVSPVIAVILMVAITVVLAATVYVWVSGFGAQSSSPAKSLAVTQAGPIEENTGVYWKNYTIASATSGMKYSDISLTLDGASLDFAAPASCAESADEEWKACSGSTVRAATALVSAGDTLTIRSGSDLSGVKLMFLDPTSNSVMTTVTIS